MSEDWRGRKADAARPSDGEGARRARATRSERLGEWASFRINSFYLDKVSFRIKSIVFRSGLAPAQNAIALSTIEKSFHKSVLVVYSLSEVRCVLGAQNIAALNWYVTVVFSLSHISLRRLQIGRASCRERVCQYV